MATGALCHPLGWGAPAVRRACGPSAGAYAPGACSPRWALALALAGACDALALAGLAFVLATRHVKLQADDGIYNRPGSVYKGKGNRLLHANFWCYYYDNINNIWHTFFYPR